MNLTRTYYLTGEQLQKFESIRPVVESAYSQVLDSLTDKSVLPYQPNLYPTPFMLVMQYRVGSHLARVLCYSLTYPDVIDFNHLGIYITLSALVRFPQHIVGIIGHEVAHVMTLRGEVELNKEGLLSMLRDKAGYIQARERKSENFYKYFSHPVRAMISKWNSIAELQETGEYVSKDAQSVDILGLEKLVFRDKLEDYHRFIRAKLEQMSGI